MGGGGGGGGGGEANLFPAGEFSAKTLNSLKKDNLKDKSKPSLLKLQTYGQYVKILNYVN